jgi:hypothetical protein
MRTLTFSLCGYRASMALPAEYFDDYGRPKWNLLNNRFSSPFILWDRPIGGVPVDEPVNQPTQIPTIKEEVAKLREVVVSLEKKFDGVR